MDIRVSADGMTLYLGDQVLAYIARKKGWGREAWFVGEGLEPRVKAAVSNAIFSLNGCPWAEDLAKRIQECFTG